MLILPVDVTASLYLASGLLFSWLAFCKLTVTKASIEEKKKRRRRRRQERSKVEEKK